MSFFPTIAFLMKESRKPVCHLLAARAAVGLASLLEAIERMMLVLLSLKNVKVRKNVFRNRLSCVLEGELHGGGEER